MRRWGNCRDATLSLIGLGMQEAYVVIRKGETDALAFEGRVGVEVEVKVEAE